MFVCALCDVVSLKYLQILSGRLERDIEINEFCINRSRFSKTSVFIRPKKIIPMHVAKLTTVSIDHIKHIVIYLTGGPMCSGMKCFQKNLYHLLPKDLPVAVGIFINCDDSTTC